LRIKNGGFGGSLKIGNCAFLGEINEKLMEKCISSWKINAFARENIFRDVHKVVGKLWNGTCFRTQMPKNFALSERKLQN
jgi:hypothetical protein